MSKGRGRQGQRFTATPNLREYTVPPGGEVIVKNMAGQILRVERPKRARRVTKKEHQAKKRASDRYR